MVREFKLPELGENIETGDVIKVLVKVGDTVSKDQPVLEIETDKATLEVPVNVAGRVEEIRVRQGEAISVGQTILTVDDADAAPEENAGEEPAGPAKDRRHDEARRVEARAAEPAVEGEAQEAAAEEGPAPAEPTTSDELSEIELVKDVAPSSPSVRRMARELGVDIHRVEGSGPGGRISAEDIKSYVRSMSERRTSAVSPRLPDFETWGPVRREPVSAVRRTTAAHVGIAWSAIPHVTQHELADITELERHRKRYRARVEAEGGKLTMTAIALKIIAAGLRQFPRFNASLDVEAGEIVYKEYCHVGVAVDTDRGLLVPVIRDVDRKNLVQLSRELKEVAEKARDRKLRAEDLSGGCFTITNLGGIGGTSFTPIVHWPEVAILGISRARPEPLLVEGRLESKLMLPVSLSYDHRVIDGADGARFLRWVADAFENPFLLFLEG